MKIENNAEKRWMKIKVEDKDSLPLEVKVKFFELDKTEDDQEDAKKRLRIRFTKKRGDLLQWYEIFKQMQETQLENVLLAPRVHQN
mmetsp:Transcript_13573/g.23097  ORF Transcript_13573/g.23097 Transcript_13573/m.23097 type:complete len:86 (+) Transcript_13573:1167-1424(+)